MVRLKGRTFFYKKNKNDEEKDYTVSFCIWSVLLVLICWTLWAIIHFSKSVVVPAIMIKAKKVSALNGITEETELMEDNQDDDEDELFKNKMQHIPSSTCDGPGGILLLKTHKTGSSTLANILNRYADEKKFTVAIPHHESRFGWPNEFDVRSVDKKLMNGRNAKVFTSHARLNREVMDEVMVPDSYYISILRNPVDQYQSAFYYLQMDKVFGLRFSENPLQEFITDPTKYMRKLRRAKTQPEDSGLYQNGMFFDLGYDVLQLKKDGIGEAIGKLETDIDFFLILEYFDESLVLLKKEMCWSIDNILYFKQNQRTWKVPINDQAVENIKQWNSADVRLYEHFNKTFWQRVIEYGPSFKSDLEEFREYLKLWSKRCDRREVIKGADASAVRFYKVGENANKEDIEKCQKFFRTELQYLTHFRTEAMREFYERSRLLNIPKGRKRP